MDCREMVELLGEYMEKELAEEVCQCIEKHLNECDRCKNLYETYREVIELCQELFGNICVCYARKNELLELLRNKLNYKEV